MVSVSFLTMPLVTKVWISVGDNWRKGEVVDTEVGHTDYMAVEGKKPHWHLGS